MRKLIIAGLWLLIPAVGGTVTDVHGQDAIVRHEPTEVITAKPNAEELATASLLAVIEVNNNGDATDAAPGDGICETSAGNGVCTLRAAVVEANALAGDDTIIFDPSITSIDISGQIAISSNMSIIGNGPNLLTIRNISPLSTTSRIFNITNFIVNISGMTLTEGNVTGNGGAIQNTGNLTISNCVIRQNNASAFGGGVRSTNNLTIYRSSVLQNQSTASTSGGISFAGANLNIAYSTIANNTSSGNGGGINSSATVSMTLRNSTISGNTAGASSGGMFANRGTIINSTISGNTANGALATDGGGGLRFQAGVNTIFIVSSTITNNTAPNTSGGTRSGIWHETGFLEFHNTIVAGNNTQDIAKELAPTVVNNGFNLIGRNTSVETEFPAGLPSGTSYVGTQKSPLDPILGELGNNGGPTLTHLPMEGSVAIDNGAALGSVIDQRGFVRPFDVPSVPNSPSGDGSDIGAVEVGSSLPTDGAAVAGRVLDSGGNFIPYARIFMTDPSGNSFLALASSFGYFSFDNIPIGTSYVVTVESKRFSFSPIVVNVDGDISSLEIIALP